MPCPLRIRLVGVRRWATRLRPEQGDSILEAALVLPIIFLMSFGFIDFSLIIFGMGNANFANRAALRYATLHSSTSYSPTTQQDLNKIVGTYIFGFPANTWSVVPTYYGGNSVGAAVGVQVSITYNFNVLGYTYRGISYSTTGYASVQQ
jgi:hypothetical protein